MATKDGDSGNGKAGSGSEMTGTGTGQAPLHGSGMHQELLQGLGMSKATGTGWKEHRDQAQQGYSKDGWLGACVVTAQA